MTGKVKVGIKKLHPEAVIPNYATEGSAGFDLTAVEDCAINEGEIVLIPTGLSFEIPLGYELQIRPRSGKSLNSHFRIANSPGTIDSDYRGEVMIIAEHNGPIEHEIVMSDTSVELGTYSDGIFIHKGERIAQAVLAPVLQANFVELEEFTATERGECGFGSTGV